MEAKALETAVRWAVNPSEENRRAAEEPAKAAGLEKPAGCAAHGAFWSGGSIAPPKLPPIPPAPYLTAKAVTGGLLMLACKAPPLEIGVTYHRFLELGIDIANAKHLWPPRPAKAA